MVMRPATFRCRVILIGLMLSVAVAAVVILWPGEPVCAGENSGTLTEEKLETGDIVLVHREFAWDRPYLAPIYVFKTKAKVVARVALESTTEGDSVFEFVLEQRQLTPVEARGLRELLTAEGLHKWPEYVNPQGIVDGFQWHFETWEGEVLLQTTVFDNVEPRCARNVLRAMSDLLESQSRKLSFETGDVFSLYQARSVEEMLRSADSMVEIEMSPSSIGTLRADSGAECAIALRRIISLEDILTGAMLTIDEPLPVTTEGRQWPLPHGDLFGVPIADTDGLLLRFVIDGTADDGVDVLLRKFAQGWLGEVRHLSDAGITMIGEVRLESMN